MNLEEKISSLKAKRANLLGRAKRETAKLEKEFLAQGGKRPLADKIKSFSGRYYAVVGPLLKQAKEYQKAIDLLG